MTPLVRTVLAAGLLVASVGGAMAGPFKLPRPDGGLPSASAIRLGGATAVPLGAAMLCYNSPRECLVRRARGVAVTDGRIRLDATTLATLKSVNTRVNRAIRPTADPIIDVWQVGVRSGDCEDYALTKRAQLIRRGFPSSAVVIASVDVPRFGGHAVLVVRTDRGDFVLDNLRDEILGWNKTGYRFKTIQSPDDPRSWRRA